VRGKREKRKWKRENKEKRNGKRKMGQYDIAGFDEWAKSVPDSIKQDVVWKVRAYQLGLFLSDLCWQDTHLIIKDPRARGVADQLYRATGSISANISEGLSKSTGKDRARYLEYALGPARESRDWYFKSRHLLDENDFRHRLGILSQIIRLLVTMIPQQRASGTIREPALPYDT
jgi:four helix bundle protein